MLKCYWAEIALLEKTEVFDFWFEKVNSQRREKVLRCKNQKDKQRSLMAGVVLRQALEAEGFRYEQMEFSITPEGKPYIVSHPQIQFSMSHGGNLVCCLVSDGAVGVDVECLGKSIFAPEKEKRFLSMARKCLSDIEWQTFGASDEKAKLFLEYWTRKEAYSKAAGKGLGMDFASIDTETEKNKYWTNWILNEYCISIYGQKENYEEFSIKQIESL